MRSFKNNLNLVYNNLLFLCSSSNEDSTSGDIREMGKNLAKEIHSFIAD